MKTLRHPLHGRYVYAKRMLRLRDVPFIPGGTKGYGVWILGAINHRTGSEWHSPDEAIRVVRQKQEAV